MPIRITLTPSATAALDLQTVDLDLAGFQALLEHCTPGPKDGQAIIPGAMVPCPDKCHNAGFKKKKDCGGNKPHRHRLNVSAMSALFVDIDEGTREAVEGMLANLRSQSRKFWMYETHGSSEAQFKCRVVLPFDKPMPLVSAAQWSQGAWPALMKLLGFSTAQDEACKDPSRIYFLPRCPAGETREFENNPGALLDWEKELPSEELAAFRKVKPVEVPTRQVDTSKPVDLAALKERWKRVRQGSKTYIDRALKGEPLTAPPAQRKAGEKSWHTAWWTVTGSLSMVVEGWESVDALLSMLKPSWLAESKVYPGWDTPWEDIEKMLEEQLDSAPQRKAQSQADREARDLVETASFYKAMGMRHPKDKAEDDAPADEVVEYFDDSADSSESMWSQTPRAPEQQGATWEERLTFNVDGKGNKKLANSSGNVGTILRYHPTWKNVVRFDKAKLRIEVFSGPLMDPKPNGRPLGETDPTEAANWFEKDTEVQMQVSSKIVSEQMDLVARYNSYNSLQEMLLGFWKKHDGVRRMEDLFIQYANSPTTNEAGEDITEYLRFIARRWMLSAVARAFDPGCKVDSVVHLESPEQGMAKSTFLQTLAVSPEFFSDAYIDFTDKDGMMPLGTTWIIELGEHTSFKKSDVEQQKNFLSRQIDRFRPPYGKNLGSFPRIAIFVGTTNHTQYLTDKTGNRRHWPVRVGKIDCASVKRDRELLWGEAVALYMSAKNCETCKTSLENRCDTHKWWLTDSETEILKQQTQERLVGDVGEDKIAGFFLASTQRDRPEFVRLVFVMETILGQEYGKGVRESQVAGMLRGLGFEPRLKKLNGIGSRVWLTPKHLLEAPEPGKVVPLQWRK